MVNYNCKDSTTAKTVVMKAQNLNFNNCIFSRCFKFSFVNGIDIYNIFSSTDICMLIESHVFYIEIFCDDFRSLGAPILDLHMLVF